MGTVPQAASTATQVKWVLEADFLQACNCDYGCPCEFEAPPTRGACEGMGAWRITKGRYGDVPLDGLAFGFVARWPEAIHKGNGTAVILVDERANPKQREALLNIATGQAGGMPFEIIVTTFSKVLEPQFVPFTFTLKGNDSRLAIGAAVTAAFESIKNPVTGEPEKLRIEHETGFLFKSAECVSAKSWRSTVPGLAFGWDGKAGFISKIKYSN